VRMDGQPLLSMADVQWILHNTSPDGGRVELQVRRKDGSRDMTITLPKGWRRAGDISWRSSSWGMRRMATGGMLLEDASIEERKRTGVAEGAMLLRAKHVGQYGPHAAAKNAGFRAGDLIVEFDGRTDLLREADVFHHALTERKAGDKVAVVVWREGERKTMQLPMQK
jgi:serine protease Do